MPGASCHACAGRLPGECRANAGRMAGEYRARCRVCRAKAGLPVGSATLAAPPCALYDAAAARRDAAVAVRRARNATDAAPRPGCRYRSHGS
eukprot:gene893-8146_t